MVTETLLSTVLDDIPIFKKGKVRDIYKVNEHLLIVATDRISAFDVVMSKGIPGKGKVLTSLSIFWFNFTKDIIKNHIVHTDFENICSFDKKLRKYRNQLEQRCMLVKKTEPIPIECVVRGYLAGSAWKEYKNKGSISGIRLADGLKESEKLSSPIFTPATKAEIGHDENITDKRAKDIIGKDTFEFIKEKSIAIYRKASQYALSKGIIIADTKFEFGVVEDEIILIDEILTPDSSRFWPKDVYVVGKSQPSFDKQFIRDYLESISWNKTPPPPDLPYDIVKKTSEKYLQALNILIPPPK